MAAPKPWSTARSNSETPECGANSKLGNRLGGRVLAGGGTRRGEHEDERRQSDAPCGLDGGHRRHRPIRWTVEVLPSAWRKTSFTSPTPGAN